jgi:hypothetical protein
MTKPKTLNDRVIEAKMMASLSKIESRDNHGRVKTVLVPASNATFNHVIIRRSNNGIISCECRKITPIGYIPCQGNLKGVCRHSLAAMFVAMNDNGYTPRFRHDYKDAWNHCMRNIDVMLTDIHTGQMPYVFTLNSHQGKGVLYFVAEEDSAVALKKQPNIKKANMRNGFEVDAINADLDNILIVSECAE